MKLAFKYLALGLIPIAWALPGAFLYGGGIMALAKQGIYLLPAWGALLLFCWHWISRNIERGTAVGPIFGTLLAHIPILVVIGIEAAAMKDFSLPRDAILWMGAILADGLRMPFYALCMMPLGVSGITGILMQGGCTFLLMAVVFWLGQVGAPFRARTLILPLAASLLWGFGFEWAYWPIMLLWLIWLGYDMYKWKKII